VWIDSFYEPLRIDTYKKLHWPHTLLIFGFNRDNRTFDIIEHNHRDSLAYKKRTITYEAVIECHKGYFENFGDTVFEGAPAPAYLEFSASGKSNMGNCDYSQILAANMCSQADAVVKGLSALLSFKGDYENILNGKGTALPPCVKELIAVFNKVIDNRKVESYKLSKVLGQENPLVDLLGTIAALWGEIRSDLIKFSVNLTFKEDVFKAHAAKLEEIYRLEKNYQQHLYDK
jgi:hypothetical protein